MSIGPAGIHVGAIGSPPAQTAVEADRAAHESAARARGERHARLAEAAAGISAPDGEDHQPAERDAAGRPVYESQPRRRKDAARTSASQCKDHRGERGNLLDLTG